MISVEKARGGGVLQGLEWVGAALGVSGCGHLGWGFGGVYWECLLMAALGGCGDPRTESNCGSLCLGLCVGHSGGG